MKLNFKVNPRINLLAVNDSMELDSGQEIALLEIQQKGKYKVTISIEVQGCVKVFYKDGMYKCASQMPEELLKLFHDGYESEAEHDLHVVENNWFEIYIEDGGLCVASDVVFVEGYSEIELLSLMVDTYLEYTKNLQENEQAA